MNEVKYNNRSYHGNSADDWYDVMKLRDKEMHRHMDNGDEALANKASKKASRDFLNAYDIEGDVPYNDDIWCENKETKQYTNMKKRVRLTEQDLHRIVKESVNRILKERKSLYTNGDVETAKLGSESYDDYVYHYDNNGNKVRNNWGTDIRDKHNKRAWKHSTEPTKTSLQQNTENLLPMLRSLGISVKDWRRMSSEEKQKIVNNYEGFNDPNRGEGGEGFEYLSNPSSLPAGWQ